MVVLSAHSIRIGLYRFLALLAAISILSAQQTATGQSAADSLPKLSDKPITPEEFEIYRTMLGSWFSDGNGVFNLANLTETTDLSDRNCESRVSPAEEDKREVHRIRQEDLPFLAQIPHGTLKIRLVDLKEQSKDVEKNDPGNAIRDGKTADDRSVGKAVENGFAHGMLTLGEVRFSKDHNRALVSFSFVCGSLCGNGVTMLMEKRGGVWRKMRQCGGWVS